MMKAHFFENDEKTLVLCVPFVPLMVTLCKDNNFRLSVMGQAEKTTLSHLSYNGTSGTNGILRLVLCLSCKNKIIFKYLAPTGQRGHAGQGKKQEMILHTKIVIVTAQLRLITIIKICITPTFYFHTYRPAVSYAQKCA